VKAAIYDVKLGKSDLDPEVSEPSELSIDLTLADLLASRKSRWAEASERLSQLALSHPESPEVQESIGYLEMDQGDLAKAAASFKLAIEKGSKSPQMFQEYAGVLYDSGAPASQIVAVLQQAVVLKPDFELAWYNLGLTATRAGQYAVALNAWAHLKNVKEDQAYDLFATQAYCYLQLKSPELARNAAEKAKQYAKTPTQQSQLSNLLHDVESFGHEISPAKIAEPQEATAAPERPVLKRNVPREIPRDVPSVQWPGDLQHVEAVAKSLDCSNNTRRLHVLVNSAEMIFQLADPKDIVVRNGSQGTIDLHCGSQKPYNVGIFYVTLPQPAPADGVIRELVF
jgi:tetratricopeptide (TPR) repeat protein